MASFSFFATLLLIIVKVKFYAWKILELKGDGKLFTTRLHTFHVYITARVLRCDRFSHCHYCCATCLSLFLLYFISF